MKISKAIKKINPNADFTVNGEDVNQITWLNNTTPISVEDIQAQISTVETEIKQEETNRINARTSAINKLKALGLTDEEIEAL